jgi:hypothetical protein
MALLAKGLKCLLSILNNLIQTIQCLERVLMMTEHKTILQNPPESGTEAKATVLPNPKIS